MNETRSLDQILGEFKPDNLEVSKDSRLTAHVSIWLPGDYKARYDRLQRMTGRRFAKALRELIQAAIDKTDARAS